MTDKVRYSLLVSSEVYRTLEDLADTSGCTTSDVLRKGIALLEFASKRSREGRELALIDSKTQAVVSRVAGL